MREIKHLHDTKNKGQAESEQTVNSGQRQDVKQGLHK